MMRQMATLILSIDGGFVRLCGYAVLGYTVIAGIARIAGIEAIVSIEAISAIPAIHQPSIQHL